MKKYIFVSVFILSLVIWLPNVSLAALDPEEVFNGSGTENDPFQITTCEQLQDINSYFDENYYFILNNDIDCSMTNPEDADFNSEGIWGDEMGFMPIGYTEDYNDNDPISYGDNFIGTFDGNNKTITGLYINRPTYNYVGLFGYVEEGNFENINLSNIKITGRDRVGGLIGRLMAGNVQNAQVAGEISGYEYVGGLIGGSFGDISNSSSNITVEVGFEYGGGLVGGLAGTVTNSNSSGVVSGGESSGGLVGVLDTTGLIENSYSSVIIDGNHAVGGLVGNSIGTITGSHATGAVTGRYDYVGGLVGYLGGSIEDSYATGAVVGENNFIGGLVGLLEDGHIDNSYATGRVTGSNDSEGRPKGGLRMGGFIGASSGEITNSHSTGDVFATNYEKVGGFAGGSSGLIENSYATGDVRCEASDFFSITGNSCGGLVGYNTNHVENTYAIGDVYGFIAGGLVGQSLDKTIVNSYATGDITGSIAGGLIGYLYGDFVYNSYSTGEITGVPNESLEEIFGQSYMIGGLIGALVYYEGESPDTYLFNLGWYQSRENSELSGVGVTGYFNEMTPVLGSPAEITYTETNSTAFYSRNHGIYQNAIEYDWNFNGNPWYEYSNNYPKFTEQEGGHRTGRSSGGSGSSSQVISSFQAEQYQRAINAGLDPTPYLTNSNLSQTPNPTNQTPFFTRTLKMGMQGEDVRQLQNYLNTHGYNCGIADGVFGKLTKQAVIQFQLTNGLKGDGVVGKLTREKME